MYTALIVDDEERIRRGLTAILDWPQLGFTRVEAAENGRAGAQVAREISPDLVIADLVMPGMGGIEMIRQLRSEGLQSQFIILSGVADFKYAREAIDLRVATYLLKPVDEGELREKVAELFPFPPPSFAAEDPELPEEGDARRIVAEVTDYVAQNLAAPLKLNAIAGNFHYSAPYLGRLFKKVTGQSFHDYLEKERMERAKQLLAERHKVYVVAQMVGYPNVDYFATLFKAYTGETPGDFKKRG